MPSVGAYCSARAESVAATLGHQRGERLGREGRRVRQAAGERDDLGALGDGHEVAHGRGLHDRASARRTAPRSARGRARWTRGAASVVPHCGRWARRRGPSPPAPWPLSSTVMPASSYRTVKLLLDILQGMGVVHRHRCPPLPPDAARRRPGRRRPRRRLRRHRLRLPGEPVVPAGHRGRPRGHDGAARALRDAGRRGGPGRHRHGPGGAALRRHARRPLLDVVAGDHRRPASARSSPSRGRARC